MEYHVVCVVGDNYNFIASGSDFPGAFGCVCSCVRVCVCVRVCMCVLGVFASACVGV